MITSRSLSAQTRTSERAARHSNLGMRKHCEQVITVSNCILSDAFRRHFDASEIRKMLQIRLLLLAVLLAARLMDRYTKTWNYLYIKDTIGGGGCLEMLQMISKW